MFFTGIQISCFCIFLFYSHAVLTLQVGNICMLLSMPSVNKCPGIGNPDVTLDFKASQMNGSVQCLIIYTGKNCWQWTL